MKSKLITISAVSSAFVAICLTLGLYFELVDLISLVIVSVFVILPLYYNSFLASFLSYLAGGLVALIIGGFNFLSIVIPAYFLYFGLYPIIKHLFIKKNVNPVLAKFIGLIWCVLAFYGMYFYYTAVMGLDFSDVPLWLEEYVKFVPYAVAPLGIIFFFIFDKFVVVVKRVEDYYLKRIIK